ncbi:Uncharacterized protein HZ326_2631 [Fusarium oxysporum f. sp. albedinis]|nr:Uncharacterized protein HZ326_2631 [Fusarium oxysporum f. sp. albedinis]
MLGTRISSSKVYSLHRRPHITLLPACTWCLKETPSFWSSWPSRQLHARQGLCVSIAMIAWPPSFRVAHQTS